MKRQSDEYPQFTAFDGLELLHQGALDEVVLVVRRRQKARSDHRVLVFSDDSGKQMDFDLSGSEKAVLDRLQVYLPGGQAVEAESTGNGPGRPKLGVVSREVSLLPRHWQWLSTQPGGASATLRRLVDEGRKRTQNQESTKQIQERTYRVMAAMAGDLVGYEDALRALYRRDEALFESLLSKWPKDLRRYLAQLAKGAFLKGGDSNGPSEIV